MRGDQGTRKDNQFPFIQALRIALTWVTDDIHQHNDCNDICFNTLCCFVFVCVSGHSLLILFFHFIDEIVYWRVKPTWLFIAKYSDSIFFDLKLYTI